MVTTATNFTEVEKKVLNLATNKTPITKKTPT